MKEAADILDMIATQELTSNFYKKYHILFFLAKDLSQAVKIIDSLSFKRNLGLMISLRS